MIRFLYPLTIPDAQFNQALAILQQVMRDKAKCHRKPVCRNAGDGFQRRIGTDFLRVEMLGNLVCFIVLLKHIPAEEINCKKYPPISHL